MLWLLLLTALLGLLLLAGGHDHPPIGKCVAGAVVDIPQKFLREKRGG